MKLYGIYDVVMGEFINVFVGHNDNQVQRMLSDMLASDTHSRFCSRPGDYYCSCLGFFDALTGNVSESSPYQVVTFKYLVDSLPSPSDV